MDTYFILRVIIHLVSLFILLPELFQLCPLGALLGWLLCLFDVLLSFVCTCYTSLCMYVCTCMYMLRMYVHVTLLYFLALLDVSGSSCIFPASALDSFLQEILIPFIGEWYFEVKIWMLGVLVATAARCCQWTELGNICMHTNLCIHTSIFFSVCKIYLWL